MTTNERAMRALESLTPGGSEYVNDPERCVEYVRERQATQHRQLIESIKDRQYLSEALANKEPK